MEPAVEFIVDDLFPTQCIHFFAGPSGAGKTTYMGQFVLQWREGKAVFGRKSHPVPFLYVACDRSMRSVNRLFKRVGLAEMRCISIVDREDIETVDRLFLVVKKEFPDVRLLIIDGFAMLMDDGKVNDYAKVARFMRRMNRYCHKNDLTILALGHSTKMKEGEAYLDPRQRVIGSVAWGANSETIIYIEPVHPDKIEYEGQRRIRLLPREGKQEEFMLRFNDKGLLVPLENTVPTLSKLKLYIFSLTPGEEFTFDEAKANGEATKQYTYRVLAELQKSGKVKKGKGGTYYYTPNEDPLGKILCAAKPV
jgi:RecA-family ATPase